jgi:hypothetical protein
MKLKTHFSLFIFYACFLVFGAPRAWANFAITVQGESLNYNQPDYAINVSEYDLAARLKYSEMLSRAIELQVNLGGSLATFGVSPSSSPGFSFYDAEGLFGFKLLPFFEIFGGIDYFGTSVSDQSYGIVSAVEPEVEIKISFSAKNQGEFGFYGKFAPLLNTSSFSLSSHILEAGLFLPIAPAPKGQSSTDLILGYFLTQVQNPATSLSRISLGLRQNF